MIAAEACDLNCTPLAATRALALESARVTGAEPCREACTAKAPSPTSEIASRQFTWRMGSGVATPIASAARGRPTRSAATRSWTRPPPRRAGAGRAARRAGAVSPWVPRRSEP